MVIALAPICEALGTAMGQECPGGISVAVPCDTEGRGTPGMRLVRGSEPHGAPAARRCRQDACMRRS